MLGNIHHPDTNLIYYILNKYEIIQLCPAGLIDAVLYLPRENVHFLNNQSISHL